MKRLDIEMLLPGDIIFTVAAGEAGQAIRPTTKGSVSHPIICVQHGSIIDDQQLSA